MARDSVGRNDPNNSGTGADFARALLQGLPNVMPVKVKQTQEFDARQERLIETVSEFEQMVEGKGDEVIDVLERILKEVQQIRSKAAKKVGGRSSGRGTVSGSNIGDAQLTLEDAVAVAVGDAGRNGKIPGLSGGGGKGKPPISAAAVGSTGVNPKDIVRGLGLANIGTLIASSIGYGLVSSLDTIVASSGVKLEETFKGLLKDEFDFATNMRKAVNETRGFNEQLEDTTKNALDFGKVTEETGLSRSEFIVEYVKDVRRGQTLQLRGGKLIMRNIEDQKDILKDALNVSYALSWEAGATAEMFSKWGRELQFSNVTLNLVANNMRSISRETGVTEQNLQNVVSSMDEMFKFMQGKLNLNAEAMAEVIRSQTIASKYGIETISAEVNKALRSWDYLVNQMQNKGLSSFIVRAMDNAGLVDELQAGLLGMEGYRKKRTDAMLNQAREELTGIFGFDTSDKGLASLAEQAEKMRLEYNLLKDSGDAAVRDRADQIHGSLMRLDIIAKDIFGMELGELDKYLKAQMEEGKTTAEQLADLNAELAKATTESERLRISSDIGELIRRQNDNIISVFSGQANALKDGANMAEVYRTTAAKMFEQGRISAEQVATFGPAQMRDILVENLNSMEAEAGRLNIDFAGKLQEYGFKSEESLAEAFQSNVSADRKKAEDAMAAIERELGAGADREKNPVEQINFHVKNINEMMRQMTSAFIFSLSAGGLTAIIASGLALKVGGGVLGAVQSWKFISGKTGWGQAASTAAAGATTAGATTGGLLSSNPRGGFMIPSSGSKAAYRLADGGSTVGNFSKLKNSISPLTNSFDNLSKSVKSSYTGVGKFSDLLRWIPSSGSVKSAFFSFMGGIQNAALAYRSWVELVWGGISKVAGYISGFSKTVFASIKSFDLTKAAWNFITKIPAALGGFLKLLANPTQLLGKAFSVGSRVGGTAAKVVGIQGSKAALGASTFGVATAIFAAIEGAMGAWQGYVDTPKVFATALKNADGSMKEASASMRAASTVSGFFAGALDSITFGLLGLFGLKKPLQELLAWIYYAIFDPFEKLYQGFVYGFSEAWQTVKPALDQAWSAFSEIGKVFSDVFKSIGEMFGFEVDGTGFELIQSFVEWIGPKMKELGSLLGYAVGILIKIVIPPIKLIASILTNVARIIGGAIEVISGVIGFFVNGIKILYGLLTGNEEMVLKASEAFMSAIKGIFSGLGKIIWGVLDGAFDLIAGPIITLIRSIAAPFTDILENFFDGGWLTVVKEWPMMALNGILSLGASLFEGVKTIITQEVPAAFFGIGAMIMDDLTAVFVDFPTMVYNGFEEALSNVWEWINSWVPSWGGTKEFVGNTWEAGTEAVGRAFDPINWFDEGTREIQNTGVAVVHEGEAIFPKDVWSSMMAAGSGEFGTGRGLVDTFMSPFVRADNMLGRMSGTDPIIGNVLNRGAFEPDAGKEAMMAAMESMIGGASDPTGIGSIRGLSGFENKVQKTPKSSEQKPADNLTQIVELLRRMLGMMEDQTGSRRMFSEQAIEKVDSAYIERGAFEGSSVVKDAQSEAVRADIIAEAMYGMSASQLSKVQEQLKAGGGAAVGTASVNNNLLKNVSESESEASARFTTESGLNNAFAKFVSESERLNQVLTSVLESNPILSSYLGTGAFGSNFIVGANGDMPASSVESMSSETAKMIEKQLREDQKRNIDSNVINTGAFSEKSVIEAYDFDDLEVKMAAMMSGDYNNVVDSIKSEIANNPQGGATRALYITDNGTDEEIDQATLASNGSGDIDTQLFRQFSVMNDRSRPVNVGASMFTPEDAADYVMQQLAGSTPSSAATVGGMEYLTTLAEYRNMKLDEILEELRVGNSGSKQVKTIKPSFSNAEEVEGYNPMNVYRRELVNGSWPGLQPVTGQHADKIAYRTR